MSHFRIAPHAGSPRMPDLPPARCPILLDVPSCSMPRGAKRDPLASEPRHVVGNDAVSHRFGQRLLVARWARRSLVRRDVVVWKRIVNHRIGLLLIERTGRCTEFTSSAASQGRQKENPRNAPQDVLMLAQHGRRSFLIDVSEQWESTKLSAVGPRGIGGVDSKPRCLSMADCPGARSQPQRHRGACQAGDGLTYV